MKLIKNFSEYTNESFVEFGTPAYKLQTFIEGKVKMIKKWFESEILSNAQLIDIDITKYSQSLNKNIIFNFTDGQYQFQVILVFRMQDYNDGKIGKCFMKIKKYSYDEDDSLKGTLIDFWDSNNPDNDTDGEIDGQVEIKDISPEFILDKISKMDDESQSFGSKENSISEEEPEGLESEEETEEQTEEETTF